MKIGINGRFYGARVTGVQRFAREVSSRLYERGDVVLFLPRSSPPPDNLPGHVPVVEGRLSGHLWEQLELPERASRAAVDVVLHLGGTGSARGARNVIVVYDLTPLTHPEWFTPAFRAWFRVAMGVSAQRAKALVTISEWSRSELTRVLRIDPARIRVVSQGLEPFSGPASADSVERVRRRWELPERFLLALGGRNPRKNIRFLAAVLERWAERFGCAPALIIVGEEYAWLHSRIDLPADGTLDVRFLGHVEDDDLHALYTAASVFCFPSLAEGFGRPPLEAMACGTPAVVAGYGCAAEVLGDAAPIVPLRADAWIDALRPIIEDDREHAEWSARARAHSSRYRWDAAIDDLIDVCRSTARPLAGAL